MADSTPHKTLIKVTINGELKELDLPTMRGHDTYLLLGKMQRLLAHRPPDWMHKTYAQIDHKDIKPVALMIRTWKFEDPSICSVLSNLNGIGKTHLAIATFKRFAHQQHSNELDAIYRSTEEAEELERKIAEWQQTYTRAIFTTEADLLREVQDSYDTKQAEVEVLSKYFNTPFLVIDDLFSGKVGDFARRIMLEIIDKRTTYSLPTMITSNLLLRQIADVDTRIADRLRGEQLHQIKGDIKSYRGGHNA